MSSTETRIEALHEQHREIERLVLQLSRWSKTGVGPLTDTVARLDTLLEAHFALEEDGGYLDEELAISPHLAADAEHLLAQHDALLTSLREIAGLAAVVQRAESVDDTLSKSIDEFVRQMNEHENRENRLVQDAHLDDEGGGA